MAQYQDGKSESVSQWIIPVLDARSQFSPLCVCTDQYQAARTEQEECKEHIPKIDSHSSKLAKKSTGGESAFERLYNLAHLKRDHSFEIENPPETNSPRSRKKIIVLNSNSKNNTYRRNGPASSLTPRRNTSLNHSSGTPQSSDRLIKYSPYGYDEDYDNEDMYYDDVNFSPQRSQHNVSGSPVGASRSYYHTDDIDVIEKDVSSALDDWSRLERLLKQLFCKSFRFLLSEK